MPVRSCRVTIRDMEGVDHTVQVTAGTLYEAVALGLRSLTGEEWVSGIAQGPNVARVSVTNVPIEHCVKLQDFNAWLKKEGGSPRETLDRRRIREILGFVANK
jgi:hypothetical protein